LLPHGCTLVLVASPTRWRSLDSTFRLFASVHGLRLRTPTRLRYYVPRSRLRSRTVPTLRFAHVALRFGVHGHVRGHFTHLAVLRAFTAVGLLVLWLRFTRGISPHSFYTSLCIYFLVLPRLVGSPGGFALSRFTYHGFAARSSAFSAFFCFGCAHRTTS